MFQEYFTKNLKEGEEIIRIIRQYPLTYLPSVLISLFFIIAPFFFIFPLFRLKIWGILIFLAFILFGIFFGIRKLIIWYFHSFMITNKRIVDFDQKGLFDKEISETIYKNIQDVGFRVKGFSQTFFHYGDIKIQTAGTVANLELTKVYEPQKIQELISDLQRKFSQGPPEYEEETELSARELVQMVEKIKKGVGKENFDKIIRDKKNNSS